MNLSDAIALIESGYWHDRKAAEAAEVMLPELRRLQADLARVTAERDGAVQAKEVLAMNIARLNVKRFTYDDLSAIHEIAHELGGTEGGEYLLNAENLDAIIIKIASFFYSDAAPVPAAQSPVPDWRPLMQELADDLAIELDMRYQSRHQYPSEQRRFGNEMQPVYQARDLLQSAGHVVDVNKW